MKKNLKYFANVFVIFAFFVCGFFLSSCCSPKPVKVYVNFIGADERLGLESYSYYVDYNSPTKITFSIPAGYDHNKIVASVDGVTKELKFQYDGQAEEGYEYDVGKTLSWSINSVRSNFTLDVDLTQMTKIKHKVTLDSQLNDFKIVTVSKEKTEGRFSSLKNTDVLETIEFNGKVAYVEYGSYILFVHNTRNSKYDALYSDLNHYTNINNQANIGTLNYSVYNLAKKGNTSYYYNNDPYTALYYFGEIKEDINLYSEIPNFEKDKGFDIERQPNIFYLFTNLSEYNSDILTMEAFASTTSNYDESNDNIDRIEGNVVKKVSPAEIFNDRYDVHKIYLGEDLNSEILLDEDEKHNLNTDLYFVVSSSLGIENINFNLLKDAFEKTQYGEGYKLSLSEAKTDKNRYYLKLDKNTLLQFSLDRDLVDANNEVHNYKTGSAILYPEVDYSFFNKEKMGNYTRIFQVVNINNNDIGLNSEDFHVNFYIKDGENIKYGLNEHEFWISSFEKRDCVYFKTSDLFSEPDETGKRTYKNNLYIEVRGKEYENFKSVLINTVSFGAQGETLTKIPLDVENPKVYNGYKDYLMSKLIYDNLGEYTVTITVNLKGAYKEGVALDFSTLNLIDYSDAVYITSNDQFETLNDFSPIHLNNKDDFSSIKFSMYRDLYYFTVSSNSDFDIEIRLDPDDPSTVISTSKDFCDIMGNPLTIEVHTGEFYYIKVIKQDTIFELLTVDKMYVVNKSSD